MMDQVVTLLLSGLIIGSLYAMTALGLTMIYGILNIMNFAHGEVYMIGAYTGYFLSVGFGVGYPVAMLGGIGGAALAGLLMQQIVFQPLRDAPILSALIASLGISIFLQNVFLELFSPTPRMFQSPYVDKFMEIGDISLSWQRMIVFGVGVILIGGLYFMLKRAPLGKAMRATALDSEMASLMGIDVRRVIGSTFVIGSALAGAAGVLVGPILLLSPDMGTPIILKSFAVVIMGGFGNVQGTVAAGFLLGAVESLGTLIFPSAYIDTLAFGMLILTLLIRPTGLFAERLEENV